MSVVKLRTGLKLLVEHIGRADFFARGSARNHAAVSGRPARYEEDFLYIRTVNGATYVRGGDAAQDANALESAGICVRRSPSSPSA